MAQPILPNHETIESDNDSLLLMAMGGNMEELGCFGKEVNEMTEVVGAQIINSMAKSIDYIELMRLGKQNTGTQGDIEQSAYTFLLKRNGSSSTDPCVRVNFSPQAHPQANQHTTTNDQKSLKNYPSFNQDGLHFTPAFFLQEDKNKMQKNLQCYLNLHEERARQAAGNKQQIYVPKPSKANSFCSICRVSFEDYLTHLNMPNHQSLLRSSPFCRDITQMCDRFVQKKNKAITKSKTKGKKVRKCRVAKQQLSYTNYTTTSSISIEEQKVMQEVC